MARRALVHSMRAISDAMKASSNSSCVVVRSLATAIANHSVLVAYAVMSLIFSAQTWPALNFAAVLLDVLVIGVGRTPDEVSSVKFQLVHCASNQPGELSRLVKPGPANE
jgi:hypothetical protein